MDRLSGKVAIVTGGSVGIGAACVERMVGEGARVVIADVQPPAAALLDRLPASAVRFVHTDVAREQDVADAVAHAVSVYGRLDVMVNNAGITGANKPTDQLTESEWDRVQQVNVKGVFFGTKHAIAPMRLAGGGSIVNLSSIYGLIGAPDLPPYHASKGAVRLMTKTDALLFAKDRIRVNSVHPGFIRTPMVEGHVAAMGGDDAGHFAQIAALHPMGRLGTADEVAWCVVFLASDESSFITGAELVVDGGYTAR